jgi:hypothetical protein
MHSAARHGLAAQQGWKQPEKVAGHFGQTLHPPIRCHWRQGCSEAEQLEEEQVGEMKGMTEASLGMVQAQHLQQQHGSQYQERRHYFIVLPILAPAR